MMISQKILVRVCMALFLLSPTLTTKAGAAGGHGEKFEPGYFILDHIGDAYDGHLFDWKGKQFSVPLPVILYSKQHGFNVFLSSKFHHGHSAHAGFHIAMEGDHRGKIVETLADGSVARPMLDLSITKMVFALFVSVAVILWVFLTVAKAYTTRGMKAPKGLQSLIEPLMLFVRDDIARPAIGYKYRQFMPYLLTVFFFILINNLMGLIPIFPFGANVTGNIAITMVLALATFTIIMASSTKTYWGHIFNTPGVPWWLKIPLPLMPFIELLGVFTKPFVLMMRLFANVTAGHIIILAFISLIFIFGEMSVGLGFGSSILSVLFIIFMSFIELLVAFIQAYVFTLLSAIYFGMAVEEHH